MTGQPPGNGDQDAVDDIKDMRTALAAFPNLNDYGFGVYDAHRKTQVARIAEIDASRATMLGPQSVAVFRAMRNWLRQWSKTRLTHKTVSSYGLKHVAEHDVGYATNGVFIAAAFAEGFQIQRDGPNARINISLRAWTRRDARA